MITFLSLITVSLSCMLCLPPAREIISPSPTRRKREKERTEKKKKKSSLRRRSTIKLSNSQTNLLRTLHRVAFSSRHSSQTNANSDSNANSNFISHTDPARSTLWPHFQSLAPLTALCFRRSRRSVPRSRRPPAPPISH